MASVGEPIVEFYGAEKHFDLAALLFFALFIGRFLVLRLF